MNLQAKIASKMTTASRIIPPTTSYRSGGLAHASFGVMSRIISQEAV